MDKTTVGMNWNLIAIWFAIFALCINCAWLGLLIKRSRIRKQLKKIQLKEQQEIHDRRLSERISALEECITGYTHQINNCYAGNSLMDRIHIIEQTLNNDKIF